MAEGKTGGALIFIPDITGFTNFVGKTEISHSAHIIQELLELIIAENEMGLELSEVEGDAVLFYRFGEQPTAGQLKEQSEKMFLSFHSHLKRYERDRICQCGACSTASNLSLKFVAHYGNIQEVEVGGHTKLMGPCVITSHRLLKNSVADREYLLLSDSIDSTEWAHGTDQYDESEPISYSYLPFEELLDVIPEPEALPPIERMKDPVTVELDVDAPLKTVQKVVTDIDLKPLITPNVVKIEYEGRIPAIGTQHQCVLENTTLSFLAVHHKEEKDKFEYAEKLIKPPPIAPGLTFLFVMERISDNQTRVRAELHYKKIAGGLLNWLVRPLLKMGLAKGGPPLKAFMEQYDPDTI